MPIRALPVLLRVVTDAKPPKTMIGGPMQLPEMIERESRRGDPRSAIYRPLASI
jgi:hypothetical protein